MLLADGTREGRKDSSAFSKRKHDGPHQCSLARHQSGIVFPDFPSVSQDGSRRSWLRHISCFGSRPDMLWPRMSTAHAVVTILFMLLVWNHAVPVCCILSFHKPPARAHNG